MISRLLTPTFRISFGLAGITLSLIMFSYVIGLFPNQEEIELRSRASVAEALALQLSSAASQYDTRVLKSTIDTVVERNPNMLSIALRRRDGKILLSAGDHSAHWKKPHESRSSPTHIQVSLSDGKQVWGDIEMSFTPLVAAGRVLGVPKSIGALVLYIGAMGFVGYYFVLRRALKELDPGTVIPDRVQSAFNSLAEGILILDERGLILLANTAFAEAVGKDSKSLFGTEVSNLKWRHSGGAGEFPWDIVIQSRQELTGARLTLQIGDQEAKNFVVNATCIAGPDGHVTGVIATFDDVTELERKNDDLRAAVQQLQQSEEEISEQNRELKYLASHDSLTGCLNRRAFFEQFSVLLAEAEYSGSSLTCMMADLDHFKNVNDTYGHAIGDKVISGMAGVLKEACGQDGLVGRYGGEEFCLVVPSLSVEQSAQLAEVIRETVMARSPSWLQRQDKNVTSSIGIALRPGEICTVTEFVDWADQALYEAKETGRNKVVFWDSANLAKGKKKQPKSEKGQEIAALLNQSKGGVLPGSASSTTGSETRSVRHEATIVQTGLPSEAIFQDRLAQSIARADSGDKKVALLQVSLDSLEELTAAYGEDIRGEFVTVVASRFKSALKRSDTISTMNGSKRSPSLCNLPQGDFVIEISDLEETNTVVWIIKRLLDSLAAPLTIKNEIFYASVNIGVSMYPNDGRDADALMRKATTACQHADKADGKNNYQFFSEEMNENSRRQIGLVANIRQALDEGQFLLNYQPIVDVETGGLKAMETLLRSDHPQLGTVPIGTLISIAEQTGLVIEIGEFVLKNAIWQIQKWQELGLEVPRISINLSAIQLNNKAAMQRVLQILSHMPIDPSYLQFEVTETAILRDNNAAADSLEQIRMMGILIALDDFGTGQSSLGYLRRFRPDVIKIDRCFIGEITTSHADETLVSAIVSMAQRLEIDVVAEGVETERQLEKVCEIGCNAIQGYYFARPMPATLMTKWLSLNQNQNLMQGAIDAEDSQQISA